MNPMDTLVSSSAIIFEVGTYWVFSMLFLTALDIFAMKRIPGGRRALGYRILRFLRFFSLVAVSLVTIIVFVLCMNGLEVQSSTLTFFGVPYFIVWVFFLINVLQRVRAERKGRDWGKKLN